MSRRRFVHLLVGIPGRVAVALAFAVGWLLDDATDGRSFGPAIVLLGVLVAAWAWAMWTDLDGMWSRQAERERRRVEEMYQRPLARSTIARWVIELDRRDTQFAQGRLLTGFVTGLALVLLGILLLTGVEGL